MRVVAFIAVVLGAAWAVAGSSAGDPPVGADNKKPPHVHKHQHRDGGSTMDEEKEEE